MQYAFTKRRDNFPQESASERWKAKCLGEPGDAVHVIRGGPGASQAMVSELFDHCDTVYRPSGGLRILMLDSLMLDLSEEI